jgi:hypothetical protein
MNVQQKMKSDRKFLWLAGLYPKNGLKPVLRKLQIIGKIVKGVLKSAHKGLENQEKVIEYLQKSVESCDCPVLPSIMTIIAHLKPCLSEHPPE